MATLNIFDVDETAFTFEISDLEFLFTVDNYLEIGLTTRNFTDGQPTEPSGTFWSGEVAVDVDPRPYHNTGDIEIEHGLDPGEYTVRAWAKLTNGRYYKAGSDAADIPEEYISSTYQWFGGYGGGAAAGADGGAGKGTRTSQSGGAGADAAATGDNAAYGGSSSATYYGYGNGGNGGHGGGGGGGGGYNTKNGGAPGGAGGTGSWGGNGAPGCVLIYY